MKTPSANKRYIEFSKIKKQPPWKIKFDGIFQIQNNISISIVDTTLSNAFCIGSYIWYRIVDSYIWSLNNRSLTYNKHNYKIMGGSRKGRETKYLKNGSHNNV